MCSNEINKNISDYLNNKEYHVEDVKNCDNCKEVEYLFILESPHTEEIKNGYPLAGESGKDVSRYLLNINEPFGKLIKEKKLKEKKIAIVNVSNVPLQPFNTKKDDKEISNIKDIDKIKNNLESIRKREISDSTIGSKKLFELFKKRISEYIENNESLKFIILCGEFVKKYFDYFLKNSKVQVKHIINLNDYESKILYVPHPSRHQWTFIDKYKINLETLKNDWTNNSQN